MYFSCVRLERKHRAVATDKVRTNIYLTETQRDFCADVADEVEERTGESCSMADVVRLCINLSLTMNANLTEDIARRPPFLWLSKNQDKDILKTIHEIRTGELELNQDVPDHSIGEITHFLAGESE
jgi:hypothetical protein